MRARIAENVAEEFGAGLIAYADADVTLRRSTCVATSRRRARAPWRLPTPASPRRTPRLSRTAPPNQAGGCTSWKGSVAELTRTDLTANVAPSGAGARVVRSATLVVVGGIVARNNATADGGGGILCDGGEVTLANVRVEENTCNTLGVD